MFRTNNGKGRNRGCNELIPHWSYERSKVHYHSTMIRFFSESIKI